jgi:hypothetical protein
MHATSKTVSRENVDGSIKTYLLSVETIGDSIAHLRGFALLEVLKRKAMGTGPYSNVSLFEAANRIMTDLVILHGINWLLDHRVFPFFIPRGIWAR